MDRSGTTTNPTTKHFDLTIYQAVKLGTFGLCSDTAGSSFLLKSVIVLLSDDILVTQLTTEFQTVLNYEHCE